MLHKLNCSILNHLPRKDKFLIHSKIGIAEYYKNCYISAVIHSLPDTAIQVYTRFLTHDTPTQIVVYDCKTKI